MTGLTSISPSRVIFAFLVSALIFACPGAEKPQKPEAGPARVIINTSKSESREFEVELARTGEQTRRGLMHRKSLERNKGMLFIMPYSDVQKFWMKNTLIPLDLIFIGEDMEIKGIIKNAAPESLSTLKIDRPSRYVLEINGGLCDKLGIAAGDKVKLIGAGVE